MKSALSLPVLPTAGAAAAAAAADDDDGEALRALGGELRRSVRGQVRFGAHDRALYSTDASPYQVMPLGVVVPADAGDIATVLQRCAHHRIPVLPRGGGTSLAGQCTSRAVVIDLSAMCRRVLWADAAKRLCEVEAGVSVDELNRQLAQLAPGLLYAPDPATVAQATIGGCIGNNAAGARSIRYGRTSENVAGIDVLLATGERLWLELGAGRHNAMARRLAVEVADVVMRHAELIRARFAKTIRRNAGYGLDLILKQLDDGVQPQDLDLSGRPRPHAQHRRRGGGPRARVRRRHVGRARRRQSPRTVARAVLRPETDVGFPRGEADLRPVRDPQSGQHRGRRAGRVDNGEPARPRGRRPRQGRAAREVETYFDYGDQDDFAHAVDMCNGAGFCRKTAGGTMCPSYRATMDERHSTRGRGNALRQAIRVGIGGGGGGEPAWNDPDTMATLDLCLSCKACKSECPSNVDVARLKAEYLAQSWNARGGAPLKARAFGQVRKLNALGAVAPRLANLVNNLPPVRAILNRMLNLAPKRSLPPFAPSLHKWFRRSSSTLRLRPEGRHREPRGVGTPKVLLYADCFATYNEPNVGQAAVKVLEACGYEVLLPRVACCGRSMISTGLLPDAIASAERALATLSPLIDQVRALVVCEPSCLSAVTDDWLQLKLKTPLEARLKVAAKAMLVEQFVDRFWDSHPRRPALRESAGPVLLHGHCHQKAVGGGEETSARLLRRVSGENLSVIPSGCCGMAGSFGYDADKFELSMAIGELSLFPPIRSAPAGAVICAPGTSCRHQIHDGTGRVARHPIELAASLLCEDAAEPAGFVRHR